MKSKPSPPKPLELHRFGLSSEAEWLLIAPSRFEDYLNEVTDFRQLVAGNPALVRGTIVVKKLYDGSKRATTNIHVAERLFVVLKNRFGQEIGVSAFGRPGYAWEDRNVGDTVLVYANPQMQKPPYEGLVLTNPTLAQTDQLGRIISIYPSVKQTKGSRFADEVHQHEHLLDIAAEFVEAEVGWRDQRSPVSMTELTGFASARDLICALHDADSVAIGDRARRAAKLLSAVAMVRKSQLRAASAEANPRSIIAIRPENVAQLKRMFPFALTKDQENAIDGICGSLRSPMVMNGLLSGDVGSGKTAAFLVPMVAVHETGKRAMLLTPNLLLISQVAAEMKEFFPDVPVCTITGDGIKGDPHAGIIIGNTALFSAMNKGKLAGVADFLVVDEQHKFSVGQREALCGRHTNLIEATATPIPRTTALISHGTKDVYILREIPVKKTIHSTIVGREDARAVRDAIVDAIYTRREQAAVVYPLVKINAKTPVGDTGAEEKSNKQSRLKKAVTGAMDLWSKHVHPDLITVLHGRMTDEEKKTALEEFKSGRTALLLATTVIEVGMTVPALKTMAVLDADKLGVVQLHQLRGRLARHGGEGRFMMCVDDPAEESIERLQLLVDHPDGFTLAEKDAELRGYGDFLSAESDAQSGVTRSLFLGVKVGPREIGYAYDIYQKKDQPAPAAAVATPPARRVFR